MATEKRKLKAPTGAILSKYLRALALEVETVNADGDPVVKAEALAELVWKYALGFDKKEPDSDKTTYIPPATWAIEILYNRIEGKIPVAVVEDQGRSLTEKVSDLGKAKINAMTKAATEDSPDEDQDG
jgi:hypothetical protein